MSGEDLPVPAGGDIAALTEVEADASPAPTADLSELAARIDVEHKAATEAVQSGLGHALEAGRLLNLAKKAAVSQHGKWLPWLAENCSVSSRMAAYYMRLDRNRDRFNSQIRNGVSNLTLRQALRSIPTRMKRLAQLPAPTLETVLAEEKEDAQDKALEMARKKERVHNKRRANAEKGSARKDLLAIILERHDPDEQAQIARLLRVLDQHGFLGAFIVELEQSAKRGLPRSATQDGDD
jgi:hypothetical protein